MSKLKLLSNILAFVIFGGGMGGALYYYNFVDKAPVSGIEAGNKCPDFTVQTYEVNGDTFSVSESTFTLSQQIGQVCIINFWEVWCQACIEELPEFNKIQEEYGEKVEVVAVVGKTSEIGAAAKWMTNKKWQSFDKESDWADFSLTFAYMPQEDCIAMGCGSMLPRTVIMDKSGIVAHEQDGSMTYDDLERILADLL